MSYVRRSGMGRSAVSKLATFEYTLSVQIRRADLKEPLVDLPIVVLMEQVAIEGAPAGTVGLQLTPASLSKLEALVGVIQAFGMREVG